MPDNNESVAAPSAFQFSGQTAAGYARQHNGNNYNSTVKDYNYRYTLAKRRSDETLRGDERNVQLIQAAAEGQTPRIRHLLDLGADFDFRDELDLTALHHAVLSGFEDSVEMLLERGANVNSLTLDYGTPLCMAVLKDRISIVHLLLRYRARCLDAVANVGTPLHCAAWTGNTRTTQTLIDHVSRAGSCPSALRCTQINIQTLSAIENWTGISAPGKPVPPKHMAEIHRPTPFHVVLGTHNLELMRALPLQLLNLDEPIYTGSNPADMVPYAPLVFAVSQDQPEMIQYLLAHGADVDAIDSDGYTALAIAVAAGADRCVGALLSGHANVDMICPSGDTALALAADLGERGCLLQLLSKGASVHQPNRAGSTPLCRAAAHGHTDCVGDLLRHDALSCSQVRQVKPLCEAVTGSHLEVCVLLLEHGVDMQASTGMESGSVLDRLLDVTADGKMGNRIRFVDSFLSSVSMIDRRDAVQREQERSTTYGETLSDSFRALRHHFSRLALAQYPRNALIRDMGLEKSLDSHDSIVPAVMALGGDIDMTDSNGMTALHHAVDSGLLENVCRLLSAGANAIRTEKGRIRSPLWHAAASGQLNRVNRLLEYGSEIHSVDGEGSTPLLAALQARKFDVCTILILEGAKCVTRSYMAQCLVMASPLYQQAMLTSIRFQTLAESQCNTDAAQGGGESRNTLGGGFSAPGILERTILHLAATCVRLSGILSLPLEGVAKSTRKDSEKYARDRLSRALLEALVTQDGPRASKLLAAGGAATDLVQLFAPGLDTPIGTVTFLHLAATVGSATFTLYLTRAGADMNATNSLGHTPRDCADACGHTEALLHRVSRPGDLLQPREEDLIDLSEEDSIDSPEEDPILVPEHVSRTVVFPPVPRQLRGGKTAFWGMGQGGSVSPRLPKDLDAAPASVFWVPRRLPVTRLGATPCAGHHGDSWPSEDATHRRPVGEHLDVIEDSASDNDYESAVSDSSYTATSKRSFETVDLETDPPRWNTPGWCDRTLEVQAFGPDVLKYSAQMLNNMMAADEQIQVSPMDLRIHSRSRPFAQGTRRTASYARTAFSNNYFVIKSSNKTIGHAEAVEGMRIQALCKAFALEFNGLLWLSPPLDFVVSTVLVEKGTSSLDPSCLSLEPFLTGEYKKYNNNGPWVNSDDSDKFNQVAQSFSHFTFERSRGLMLVNDLQGVGHVLFDPTIQTEDSNRFQLSDTNLGEDGFKFFFSSHECNQYCRELGLKSNREMFSTHFEFRKTWPIIEPTASCSSKLCRKIIRMASARESGDFPGHQWCDECWMQLEGSLVSYECEEIGPDHEFKMSRFYHESQGEVIPKYCPDHRPKDASATDTAAVSGRLFSRGRLRHADSNSTRSGNAW